MSARCGGALWASKGVDVAATTPAARRKVFISGKAQQPPRSGQVGGWGLEVGRWRLEDGGWRLEVGRWGLGIPHLQPPTSNLQPPTSNLPPPTQSFSSPPYRCPP